MRHLSDYELMTQLYEARPGKYPDPDRLTRPSGSTDSDAAGFPQAAFTVRGMGFRDGAEDVRLFRRACLEGNVAPGRSLLLRAALAEARTVADPASNEKLAKGVEGRRRRRVRDDAAAAAILAVAEGVRRGERPKRSWYYRGAACDSVK